MLITTFLWLSLLACALQPGNLLVELGVMAPTPTPDPFVPYRAFLQLPFRGDIEAAAPLPRYHITCRLEPGGDSLSGVMQVTTAVSGSELLFRLYPNLDNYNGLMAVTQAQINDTPVAITPLADGTAIRLDAPGAPAEVTATLNFTVQLPRPSGSSYTLFGWDGPILSLPGFYPALAVRQNGEWALDQPPAHGDVLFNEAALYQLDITLPPGLVVVSSGVTLNAIGNPDGSRTWQIVGGPLRDMTVIAGPFQAMSENAAGTVVTAYYLSGHEVAAQSVLSHATASLRFYSELYGRYPYIELDVVEAPLNVRGMEYSGLILIGQDLYQNQPEFLTFLVAHEVAHQWWYALVGNNPYRHPWLDEGLTEYSAFDYYRSVFGQTDGERLLTERWFISFDDAAKGGIAGLATRPANAFDPASYELLVYTKTALFFNALRAELGEETYGQFLRTYYAENRYRLVTPQTLLTTAERVSGQDLSPLTKQWLR